MAEARVARATTVDTQHLLLGLLREERGIAAQVLLDFGVTAEKARAELARLV
jgi:ATP-dependent Clp protease ATP-binding subunit ClpC